MDTPFGSNKIVQQRISEATLRVFDAGFDQGKYRLKSLSDLIMRALPEFALGYAPAGIPNEQVYDRVKEAAEILYSTDQYSKRGEFGELILHLVLRDFCNTTPLISKIYFKDSTNVTVHGFDAIHITDDAGSRSLWLGEAKMHQDAGSGISSLLDDLRVHFEENYLRKEFFCITQKTRMLGSDTLKEKEYWLDLMDKHTTLDRIFSSITIPMLCIYDSDIFRSHTDATSAYIEALQAEARKLDASFKARAVQIRTDLNIVLMLFPIPKKDELLAELHSRLKSAQNI